MLIRVLMSGWRDSNPRPPAPKAGALTGLRYTPKTISKKSPDPLTGFSLAIKFPGSDTE